MASWNILFGSLHGERVEVEYFVFEQILPDRPRSLALFFQGCRLEKERQELMPPFGLVCVGFG